MFKPLSLKYLLDRPTASNPHPFTRLLIQGTAGIWKEYVEHQFVKQLAQGTLPRECFIHFIKSVSLHTITVVLLISFTGKTTCICGTTLVHMRSSCSSHNEIVI